MLKSELEAVKFHARAIAKEEIAAADFSKRIKALDVKLKGFAARLDSAVKLLDAKIKKVTPAVIRPKFTKDKEGGK